MLAGKIIQSNLAEFGLTEIMVGLRNDAHPRFLTATFKNTLQ